MEQEIPPANLKCSGGMGGGNTMSVIGGGGGGLPWVPEFGPFRSTSNPSWLSVAPCGGDVEKKRQSR